VFKPPTRKSYFIESPTSDAAAVVATLLDFCSDCSLVYIDAYSSMPIHQLTDEARKAEQLLRTSISKTNSDQWQSIQVGIGDPRLWQAAAIYAPWSISADYRDSQGNFRLWVEDSGQQVGAYLTDAERDLLIVTPAVDGSTLRVTAT